MELAVILKKLQRFSEKKIDPFLCADPITFSTIHLPFNGIIIPDRRRRSTIENEMRWEWFAAQPIETSDANEKETDLHLEQFDGLDSFDWKNAIGASKEDDYSDFRALALFEENVINNYGHQLIDMIVQCTFDGVTCSLEDFDVIKNPFYG